MGPPPHAAGRQAAPTGTDLHDRRFRPQEAAFDIEVALHEVDDSSHASAPASRWALTAAPGTKVSVRSKASHDLMCVLIVRAEVLDHSMGLLGPTRLAQQSDKDVQGIAITVFGAVAQRRLHPPLAKRSVESPTCVNIGERALCEFRESFRTDEQIHVPQMVVVPGRIGGVALGVRANQRDGRIPIPALFRCPGLLAPLHRTSIA
ncbi:hypothetical protein GCM10017776_56130 [Streptomyces griseoluteus]|nr:hypothetical protein GCM10017776_56130 [Streptomyces griseoluteus]